MNTSCNKLVSSSSWIGPSGWVHSTLHDKKQLKKSYQISSPLKLHHPLLKFLLGCNDLRRLLYALLFVGTIIARILVGT